MLDKVEKKKKFVPYPKGRNVSLDDIRTIGSLIKDLPLKRDLLIEYLHLIQDKFRCIKKKHLAALAEIMKIPFAETFEVASFYAHFDVIEDYDVREGVKDFSSWPTLPQIYMGGEFMGGSDILTQMHDSGELKQEIDKLFTDEE